MQLQFSTFCLLLDAARTPVHARSSTYSCTLLPLAPAGQAVYATSQISSALSLHSSSISLPLPPSVPSLPPSSSCHRAMPMHLAMIPSCPFIWLCLTVHLLCSRTCTSSCSSDEHGSRFCRCWPQTVCHQRHAVEAALLCLAWHGDQLWLAAQLCR